jgi:D-methionine transport system substrate-binding protein
MKQFFYSTIFILASLLLILTSCGQSSKPTLKVASTSVPHAEILEFIQPHLQTQNIALEIIIIDDFNTPNRALADREVDANFFQHLPFLEAQKADFGYELESLVAVHLEPMVLYSKKHHSLEEIKDGATIAVPSDVSNQARALALCEQAGLIALNSKGAKTSLLDIASNPRHLHFLEMDSALLSRALEDADAATISTNFALLGGLSPKTDGLATENGQSRFSNLVVIRAGESQRAELQTLKAALTHEKVRQFIEEHYQGAVIPSF